MREFFKEYFTFSSSERNGVLILLLVLFAVAITPSIMVRFHKSEPFDFTTLDEEVQAFIATTNADTMDSHATIQPFNHVEEDTTKPATLYQFDPNHLTRDEWIAFGIKPGIAKIILNYLSKGGRFYKKEDLKKIYGLQESDYIKLAPYITIPLLQTQTQTQAQPYTHTFTHPNPPAGGEGGPICINSSTASELTQLYGIGEILSSRIIKYRDLLGGFVEVTQLLEVYGIDSIRYANFEKNITIVDSSISRISLNTATFEQMKKHPYISAPIAGGLVKYRSKAGPFKTKEDIKELTIISNEDYRRFIPYIEIE
ncbi:MAG: helix-hairpin-helix domain-containing protein [Bacteroidetes bacterium]|nr:helix-hairpin-helix domain-containing protein [Bacteroidota bacterium]